MDPNAAFLSAFMQAFNAARQQRQARRQESEERDWRQRTYQDQQDRISEERDWRQRTYQDQQDRIAERTRIEDERYNAGHVLASPDIVAEYPEYAGKTIPLETARILREQIRQRRELSGLLRQNQDTTPLPANAVPSPLAAVQGTSGVMVPVSSFIPPDYGLGISTNRSASTPIIGRSASVGAPAPPLVAAQTPPPVPSIGAPPVVGMSASGSSGLAPSILRAFSAGAAPTLAPAPTLATAEKTGDVYSGKGEASRADTGLKKDVETQTYGNKNAVSYAGPAFSAAGVPFVGLSPSGSGFRAAYAPPAPEPRVPFTSAQPAIASIPPVGRSVPSETVPPPPVASAAPLVANPAAQAPPPPPLAAPVAPGTAGGVLSPADVEAAAARFALIGGNPAIVRALLAPRTHRPPTAEMVELGYPEDVTLPPDEYLQAAMLVAKVRKGEADKAEAQQAIAEYLRYIQPTPPTQGPPVDVAPFAGRAEGAMQAAGIEPPMAPPPVPGAIIPGNPRPSVGAALQFANERGLDLGQAGSIYRATEPPPPTYQVLVGNWPVEMTQSEYNDYIIRENDPEKQRKRQENELVPYTDPRTGKVYPKVPRWLVARRQEQWNAHTDRMEQAQVQASLRPAPTRNAPSVVTQDASGNLVFATPPASGTGPGPLPYIPGAGDGPPSGPAPPGMREGARTARALKPSGPRTQALATSIAAGGTVTTAQWNAAAQQDSVDAKRDEASRKRSAQAAAAKAAKGMTVDAILKQRFTPAEARRVPDAEGRKDKDHALVLAVDPERKFPRVLRGREWMLKDGESAEWLNRLQDALDREGARTPRQRAAVGNAIQARDAIRQAVAAAGDDRAAQATAVEKVAAYMVGKSKDHQALDTALRSAQSPLPDGVELWLSNVGDKKTRYALRQYAYSAYAQGIAGGYRGDTLQKMVLESISTNGGGGASPVAKPKPAPSPAPATAAPAAPAVKVKDSAARTPAREGAWEPDWSRWTDPREAQRAKMRWEKTVRERNYQDRKTRYQAEIRFWDGEVSRARSAVHSASDAYVRAMRAGDSQKSKSALDAEQKAQKNLEAARWTRRKLGLSRWYNELSR